MWITFICTKDEHEEDDWVDEDGRHIVICLPYEEVKRTDDIRSMMLEKAMERLWEAA